MLFSKIINQARNNIGEGATLNTYLITGAAGYVGSNLIKYIQESDINAKIIALVRDSSKVQSMHLGDIDITITDLTDRNTMKGLHLEADYIFHCASITKSAEMISHPVEVIESIVNTTQNIMDLAVRCNAKSVVYVSSMEVYGNMDCSDGHRVTEDEMGEVNILNTRSCYPVGKRMAENICYSYFKEYGVPVKIARLSQTFGRGILPNDNRVFMQFARAAKNKKNIILHTLGNSMGNYCGIEDAVRGMMIILKMGVNGEAYNIVNEDNTMTIREMAELVCGEIADDRIAVEYDIPKEANKYGYASDTGLRLSGSKLAALGWRPNQTLKQMYIDVISEL